MAANRPEKQSRSDAKLAAIKTAPHSIEAEQSVLGGLMLDNQAWDAIAGDIISDDFYHRGHRLIFAAMSRLTERNQPIDLVTVSENLEAAGELQDVGGFAYLGEIAKNTPSAANIRAYAQIVRERAVLRELIAASNEIAENCYDTQNRTSAEILDLAESKVFKIAEQRTDANEGPQAISPILERTVQRIEELSTSKNANGVTGRSTGFTDLDRMTAGLQPSDLIIVAARPSMGKTTFAMNLCENVAMREDKPVLVFSLEMPAESLTTRLLSGMSKLDQQDVRSGKLDNKQVTQVVEQSKRLRELPLYIDDSSLLSPMELRARARRINRLEPNGLSLVVVDYLQLMQIPGSLENRVNQISEISRSLKSLAKELNVPVLALSQLNRAVEQRTDKRPMMADLRDSGAIEQDADVILFIYRDEVYNEDSDQGNKAEIIIGKQRNGPIGKTYLTFLKQYARFEDFVPDDRLPEEGLYSKFE